MSGNKHDGNAKNHDKKRMAKHPVADEKINNAEESHVTANTEVDQTNSAQCHPHNITFSIPDQKDKMTKSNKISLATAIFTFAYLVATLFILGETRREFKVVNRPFLEFIKPHLDSPIVGQPLVLTFTIQNLGKFPVKILDAPMGYAPRMEAPPIDLSMTSQVKPTGINKYISEGTPVNLTMVLESSLTEKRKKTIMDGRFFIYFFGEIRYKNLTTAEVGKYRFEVKLDPFSDDVLEYVVNENSDDEK